MMGVLRRLASRRTLAERYLERGLYHLDKGKYEDAIADVTEAIAHEPANAELYATRGFIYLEMDDAGYLDYARQDFEYALYLDPEQWVAAYGLGMMAYGEEDYSEALRRFDAARDSAPLRPEIYYYRALCHYRLGERQRAISEMDIATQLFEPEDRRHLDATRWIKEFKKKPRQPRLQGRTVSGTGSRLLPGGGRPSVTATGE